MTNTTPSAADHLDALLSQPESTREAWLAQQPFSAVLRQELRELAAHAQAFTAGFLDAPAAAAVLPQDDALPPPGTRLGPWAIDGALGQGGMGTVLSGHRADGAFEALVAIKLLRYGLASHNLRERFAREQRMLAKLDHPHIARLLDAGHTSEGLPYLVMARVQGQTLAKAAQGTSLDQRLQWFLQLCDALAYAHRQLLIHRDIKPSNVMVDAADQVKLLDFGVAKLLDEDAASDLTQTRALPLTPLYASPEQLRGEVVGTASDVYSLGALLYWLLTEQPPIGEATQPGAAVAFAVLNTEPQPPSDALKGKPHETVLPQELDVITLKALAKLPSERYTTVDAFAADIRAHMSGHPISAREPSRSYLATRWVQRNKLLAATAGTALAAVLMGGVSATVFALSAERARALAQTNLAQAQALTQDVLIRFGDALVTHPQGQDIHISLMRQTVAQLKPLREANPQDADLMLLEASLWTRLADGLGNTATGKPQDLKEAVEAAKRAQDLAQQAAPLLTRTAQRADALLHMGTAALIQATYLRDAEQKPKEAADLLKNAIERKESFLKTTPLAEISPVQRLSFGTRIGLLHMVLGGLYYSPNRPSLSQFEPAMRHNTLARRYYQAALDDTQSLSAADATSLPGQPLPSKRVQMQLASVDGFEATFLTRRDQLEAALAARKRAQSRLREVARSDPTDLLVRDTLWVESSGISILASRLGLHDQALSAAQECTDLMEALIAEKGPESKWAQQRHFVQHHQARIYAAAGQREKAADLARQARSKIGEPADAPPGRPRHLALQAAVRYALITQPQSQWLQTLEGLNGMFESTLTHPDVKRLVALLHAQTLAIRAALLTPSAPEQAQALNAKALAMFEKENAELPLAPDHAAWLAALKSGKPLGTDPKAWPAWPF